MFSAQDAHDESYEHDRMNWHSIFFRLTKELDPKERKNIIRNLISTDSAELNQYSSEGSFTYFDRLSFHDHIEKKRTPITLTKMKTVLTGVFTYKTSIYDWNTSTSKSKSRCQDDEKDLINKDSWSLINEDISLEFDDELDKLILEGQTLPCVHSDGFCKPTLKHSLTSLWFPEEICLIFHNSDFIGRLPKLTNPYRLEIDNYFYSTGKITETINKLKLSTLVSYTNSPLGTTTPTILRLENFAQKITLSRKPP